MLKVLSKFQSGLSLCRIAMGGNGFFLRGNKGNEVIAGAGFEPATSGL